MNKLLLAATALLVAAPVLAQTMPAGQPDRMGQGMGHGNVQGMGMKDKVQTRAEVIARTQRAFAMLDTNHDGVLDQAELTAAGRNWDGAAGGSPNSNADRPMPMDRNAMFDMIDTNHDGIISRDEFARAPMNHGMGSGMGGGKMRGGDHGGMGGGGMARMWSMADANHDGRVTLKEATDMALMRFDRMDANHDGQVTPEERAAERELRGK
ncbi:EF-hand domain-containing protein [Sphingomonas sp. RB1R13]|uniref:EF-hand domain-containing protein n=1 Tax=Sphingomonas sp. RB1R13 TaxID=3096159 RepID=UPI002FC6BD83